MAWRASRRRPRRPLPERSRKGEEAMIFLAEIGFGAVIGFAFLALIVLGVLTVLINAVLFLRRPNEVIIISGRRNRLPDGTTVGFTPIFGSWTLRVPLREQVSRM